MTEFCIFVAGIIHWKYQRNRLCVLLFDTFFTIESKFFVETYRKLFSFSSVLFYERSSLMFQYYAGNQSGHFDPDAMQTNPHAPIWQGHAHDNRLIQQRPPTGATTAAGNTNTIRRIMTATRHQQQHQHPQVMEKVMAELDTRWWISQTLTSFFLALITFM